MRKYLMETTNSESKERFADQLYKRKEKNLEFFKKNYPQMYAVLKTYKLQSSKLEIFESGEVNILTNGVREYHGRYDDIVENEVQEFQSVFSVNKKYDSVVKPIEDSYNCPRYSQRMLKNTINRSENSNNNSNVSYYIPSVYPLLVFLGCGLGKHVQMLLSKNDAQHVVIFEESVDTFYLSLYITDWFLVCQPFTNNSGRTFKFLISGNMDADFNWKLLWNELVRYCSFFPVSTFYFNHLGKNKSDKIIEKINQEIPSLLLSWGHFDDELNQLNNAIHNNKSGIRLYPGKVDKKHSSYPVLIVGSGPSLDDYVEWILSNREKVIVASCGSSLSALLRNNIKPDFHFALESDYIENELLGSIEEKDSLAETILLGAMQVNPYVFTNNFEANMAFFKDDGLVGALCHPFIHRVRNAGPTCTNTALSIIAHLGFDNIFLVGMDFGFKDLNHHHAKNTVYYDDTQSTSLKEISKVDTANLMKIQGIHGDSLWCRPYYYLSKNRLEIEIEHYKDVLVVNNLSGGAVIKGVDNINLIEFMSRTSTWNSVDRKQLRYSLILHSKNHTENIDSGFNEQLVTLKNNINQYVKNITDALSDTDSVIHDPLTILSILRNHIEDRNQESMVGVKHLINGTLKHFLYIGLSHLLSSNSSDSNHQWIEIWKSDVIQFLLGIENELAVVLNKGVELEKDIWLKRSINEAVE